MDKTCDSCNNMSPDGICLLLKDAERFIPCPYWIKKVDKYEELHASYVDILAERDAAVMVGTQLERRCGVLYDKLKEAVEILLEHQWNSGLYGLPGCIGCGSDPQDGCKDNCKLTAFFKSCEEALK
jgi:hypothetical protein